MRTITVVKKSSSEDNITFHFDDGTCLEISTEEYYNLLMFVVELKNSSEKRRREVLGD